MTQVTKSSETLSFVYEMHIFTGSKPVYEEDLEPQNVNVATSNYHQIAIIYKIAILPRSVDGFLKVLSRVCIGQL